ncbi:MULTISPECIES: hypothetical protein [unclassified Streptomyces]|uniref:hypothetical protein n=1 Tax=Streptomyces sp. NPDC017949 TaxID=3365020 RepID=UPI00379BF628
MPIPTTRHHDRLDLVAFIAVLVLGAVLLAFGVPAASLIIVAVGLTQLYGAWSSTRGTDRRHNLAQSRHTTADVGPSTPEPTDPNTPDEHHDQNQDQNASTATDTR